MRSFSQYSEAVCVGIIVTSAISSKVGLAWGVVVLNKIWVDADVETKDDDGIGWIVVEIGIQAANSIARIRKLVSLFISIILPCLCLINYLIC